MKNANTVLKRVRKPGAAAGMARLLLRSACFLFLALAASGGLRAQCNPWYPQSLSRRPANYEIRVRLHEQRHTVEAAQTVRFTNQSPVPIRALRFYLYLNAFRNTESSFLRGATRIFGQGFAERKPGEWGWITVDKLARSGGPDLSTGMRYIQPDDGNPADRTVLEVPLDKPLLPGETAAFQLQWRAQMPKTIARAGRSQDFYFFCHWFPQLGVFEQDSAGAWGWNCHQFFRQTEFYADFGVYDVHITADKKFVLGASGCLVREKDNGDGTSTRHYHVEDVIDFAWAAYPRFTVLEDQWQGVQIRLLLPPEHAAMGPRYLRALKFALAYMDAHVGPYPYPALTVVDPPFHGLHSGLMEYPTLITVGTFYGIPENIRTSESRIVPEFVHQYFMGMVASNEKEEPWLDEGFVTYFEDRITDAAYGSKTAVVDVAGYHFGNRELTRLEYTAMRNPREGVPARPGWAFSESNYKALIYSKTATTLRTVEALVGEAAMDRVLKTYFNTWRFRHPRGRDFLAVLQSELKAERDTALAQQAYRLLETGIYDAKVLDYAVTRITNETLFAPQGLYGDTLYKNGSGPRATLSRVEVQRKGDWVFPVELLVTFEDGSTQTLHWSGEAGRKVFEFSGGPKVVSAQLDPQYKLALDIDLNNNSLTLEPEMAPLWKYAAKAVFWVQNLMQALSFWV